MMSRGMALPTLSRRNPVSMTWLIRVLISITSPFLALAGATMRVCGTGLSSGVVETGGLGDDDVGAARPERAVAHAGDSRYALRAGEPDARLYSRRTGARPEMEAHHVGNRVPLGEDKDGLDVIGGAHRTFDGDLQRHRVAVLRQLRQFDLDPARLDGGILAQRLGHGLRHVLGRRFGRAAQWQNQDADRASEQR